MKRRSSLKGSPPLPYPGLLTNMQDAMSVHHITHQFQITSKNEYNGTSVSKSDIVEKRTENRLLYLNSVTNRTSGTYQCTVSVTRRGGYTIPDGMASVRIRVQCKIYNSKNFSFESYILILTLSCYSQCFVL